MMGMMGTETVDWFHNDKLFFSELKKGYPWQVQVAMDLLLEGYPVQISRVLDIPSLEERVKLYSKDDIDIKLFTKPRIHIEVKSRDFSFSGPDDYPYPTVFVGTISSWSIAKYRPQLIVVVSQITGGRIVVSAKSQPTWLEEAVHDTKRNIDCPSFGAPKACLHSWSWLIMNLKKVVKEA